MPTEEASNDTSTNPTPDVDSEEETEGEVEHSTIDAEAFVRQVFSSEKDIYITEENRIGVYDLASIRGAQLISSSIDDLTEAIENLNEEVN